MSDWRGRRAPPESAPTDFLESPLDLSDGETPIVAVQWMRQCHEVKHY